jgi:NAD+ kinase
MASLQTIGFIYNDRTAGAREMVSALVERLDLADRCWQSSANDVEEGLPDVGETDLIITIGGDGTIIRAARVSVPNRIPILGINMGRLGFMTEIEAHEAFEKVPMFLEGDMRVEERCMLQVHTLSDGREGIHYLPMAGNNKCHALNDVVVGRGAVSRLVSIATYLNSAFVTEFRADAVIVSTATGSTGYNLSVGGPILWPLADEMVLKPIAPHVGMASAMVLPASSTIDLVIQTDHSATLSVDGYVDTDLPAGTAVKVQTSPQTALFLRANPPVHFYETLTRRLGFGEGPSSTRAIQY